MESSFCGDKNSLPAHMLRDLAAACRERRGSTLPSSLASSKPCRSSAGLHSEAAAPIPKQAAVFPPGAGSTAGADPSGTQWENMTRKLTPLNSCSRFCHQDLFRKLCWSFWPSCASWLCPAWAAGGSQLQRIFLAAGQEQAAQEAGWLGDDGPCCKRDLPQARM